MSASACSSWPTPAASLTNDGESAASWQQRANALRAKGVNGNGAGMPLTIAAKAFWPTPDTPGGGRSMPEGTTITGRTLDGRKLTVGLENVARFWPTVAARDYRSPNSAESQRRRAEGREAAGQQLVNYVAHNFRSTLPDPASASYGPPSSPAIRSSLRRYLATTEPGLRAELRALIRMSICARRAGWCRAYQRPCERRQLNASFAEWLMGWPRGWTRVPTVSGSPATAFTLWLRRQRIALSTLSWSYAPAHVWSETSQQMIAEPEMQQGVLL